MPETAEEALMLDKANDNMLWSNDIAKEMTYIKIAFKILDDNESVPRNHQFFKCYMIFVIKMESFKRKARLVAGGHMTKAPSMVTIAANNDLQLKCGIVLKAYITAPVMELI